MVSYQRLLIKHFYHNEFGNIFRIPLDTTVGRHKIFAFTTLLRESIQENINPHTIHTLSTNYPRLIHIRSAHDPRLNHDLSTIYPRSIHDLSTNRPRSIHERSTIDPRTIQTEPTIHPASIHCRFHQFSIIHFSLYIMNGWLLCTL